MHPYLRYTTDTKAEIIDLIRAFSECESPSDSPADLERFTELMIESTRDLARAERMGKHLRLEFQLPGATAETQILALGHSDTVWPLGTLKTMPVKEDAGRLWGPGVLDMKAGLAFFIYAMRGLRELDVPVAHRVVLLIVSDEEVGSDSSRALTEAEATRSDFVLVLEPGTGLGGKLKTARKGVGEYVVSVTGRAAHAGVDFSHGASAILEAARQIERISVFTDLSRGLTVNPGVVRGGTRRNVIAAECQVEVDIRIERMSDFADLDRAFHALEAVDQRCAVRVEGGLNRPPMERTPAIAELFQRARMIGRDMGVDLAESSTGGGSDGNFTAALGIPTIDGLGGVGEGAHAANESILIDRIPDRVAVLMGMVSSPQPRLP